MHNRLTLVGFTAFTDLSLEFVNGLNVLVGTNATGKTHILKLLYAMQSAQESGSPLADKLRRIFRPDALGRLTRRGPGKRNAKVTGEWLGAPYGFSLASHSGKLVTEGGWKNVTRPVYIPVQDMLAHSVGFRSLYEARELDYEEVYADILNLAFLPSLRGAPTDERSDLLESLHRRMKGRVVVSDDRFYLSGPAGKLEMPLVAEGYRKLALLWLLIQNGSLDATRVLFWDEPEANLNPSMLSETIGVILQLARMGVQVFIATHSYVAIKEIDIQRRPEDAIRYFAMAPEQGGGIRACVGEDYNSLTPNAIALEFDRIYAENVQRALRMI